MTLHRQWTSKNDILAIASDPTTPGEVLRSAWRFARTITDSLSPLDRHRPAVDRWWSPSRVECPCNMIEAIFGNPNLPADLLHDALRNGEFAAWANPSTPVALFAGEVSDPCRAAFHAAMRMFVRLGWWQGDKNHIEYLVFKDWRDPAIASVARALTERADVPVVDVGKWLRADAPAFANGYCVRILVPCIRIADQTKERNIIVTSLRTGQDELFMVDPRHNDLRPVERTAIRQIVAVLTG